MPILMTLLVLIGFFTGSAALGSVNYQTKQPIKSGFGLPAELACPPSHQSLHFCQECHM